MKQKRKKKEKCEGERNLESVERARPRFEDIAMHRAGRIISQVSFDKLAPGIRYPRFTLVLSITTSIPS